MTKNLFIISCSLSILFVSSCCKCEADIEKTTSNIIVKGFSAEDFSNPRIVYKNNNVTADSIYLQVVKTPLNDISLKYAEPLNYNYDWKLIINDTLNYSINQFKIHTSTKGCCKGTYLKSYYLDGILKEKSMILIEQ